MRKKGSREEGVKQGGDKIYEEQADGELETW